MYLEQRIFKTISGEEFSVLFEGMVFQFPKLPRTRSKNTTIWLSLHCSLVCSRLDYGFICWDEMYENNLKPIFNSAK